MWDREGEDYPSPRASVISYDPNSGQPLPPLSHSSSASSLSPNASHLRPQLPNSSNSRSSVMSMGFREPKPIDRSVSLKHQNRAGTRERSEWRNERDFGWSESAGGIRSGSQAPGSSGYYLAQKRKQQQRHGRERSGSSGDGEGGRGGERNGVQEGVGLGAADEFVNRSGRNQFRPVFAPSQTLEQLPDLPSDPNDPSDPNHPRNVNGAESPNASPPSNGLGRKTSLKDRLGAGLSRAVGSLRRPGGGAVGTQHDVGRAPNRSPHGRGHNGAGKSVDTGMALGKFHRGAPGPQEDEKQWPSEEQQRTPRQNGVSLVDHPPTGERKLASARDSKSGKGATGYPMRRSQSVKTPKERNAHFNSTPLPDLPSSSATSSSSYLPERETQPQPDASPALMKKEGTGGGFGDMVRKLSRRATSGGGRGKPKRPQVTRDDTGHEVSVASARPRRAGTHGAGGRHSGQGGGGAGNAGNANGNLGVVEGNPRDRLSKHWQNIQIPEIPLYKPPDIASVPNAKALSSFAPRPPLRPRGHATAKSASGIDKPLPVPKGEKDRGVMAPYWTKFKEA